ncbi:MAG: hypothetical protein ABI863_21365 [Ginsengibacter sp.]
MRIFLRTLLFTQPFFLSPLINLTEAVITKSNPGNHSDLLIIIHDMCNAHRKVLPAMNYSKKAIPVNIFYKTG